MSTEEAPSGNPKSNEPQSTNHPQRVKTKPELGRDITSHEIPRWLAVYNRLSYVPAWCRYNPEHPVEFSMGLNILFGKPTLVAAPI